MEKILKAIFGLQDKKYAEFQSGLIPTVDKKSIIGVRTPELRTFAKSLANLYEKSDSVKNLKSKENGKTIAASISKKDVDKFLNALPHKYFDENQLHAFILSEIKNFEMCIELVNEFLPYVDNWATCDQLSPKCFKKNKPELLKYINKWLKSKKAFTIRFAIGMLMQHYLDEDYDKEYLDIVVNVDFKAAKKKNLEKIDINIDPDMYYVEMMRAWYFATALAKQYKDALPFIKGKKLNSWTQNKAIQKAVESYRVSDAHKSELKKYKI